MHEIATWPTALLTLIGFGLTMGFNPALYGATIDMLAREVRVLPRLSVMAGGLFLGATILFVLFQTFNPTSFVNSIRGRLDEALFSRTVDFVAGAVLLMLAIIIALWKLRVKVRPQRPTQAPKPNAGLISYFTIGFGSAFIGFTTLPIMYVTGRITSGLSADLVPRLAAYAVFLVALGGPFFLMAWVWSRFPHLSTKISSLYTKVLHWDYRWTLVVVFVLGGLASITFALSEPR